MIFNFLNWAIPFLNLIAVAVLLYFLTNNYRIVKSSKNENSRLSDRYYEDLLERIQRIERNHQAQATTAPDSRDSDSAATDANRIKSALTSLRNGSNPEKVRREHGYSGSEMGLIMASASLAGGESGDIDPSAN